MSGGDIVLKGRWRRLNTKIDRCEYGLVGAWPQYGDCMGWSTGEVRTGRLMWVRPCGWGRLDLQASGVKRWLVLKESMPGVRLGGKTKTVV